MIANTKETKLPKQYSNQSTKKQNGQPIKQFSKHSTIADCGFILSNAQSRNLGNEPKHRAEEYNKQYNEQFASMP